MDFTGNKQELRKRLRTARAALPAQQRAEIDHGICQNLCALAEFAHAETVFTYLSFEDEIDTRELIETAWRQGKTVALPRCVPGTRLMTWHKVDSLDNLITSKYGIDEPAADPATEIDPAAAADAIAVVPGLAFDNHGYRIGYGGGFYDIFLARFSGSSIGLCRSEFLAPEPLELEEHDLAVAIVVTEHSVFRL